jgi:microcystin-dependent protein
MRLKIVVIDLEMPARVKKWCLRVGIPLGAVLGGGAIAWAAGLHTWNPGDKLLATDLNANFAYLQGEIGAGIVPSGAVMAFNLPACPTGWAPVPSAAGRVVVGTSPTLILGATVGADTVALSDAQLPAHAHGIADPGHHHASGELTFMTWSCMTPPLGFAGGGAYSTNGGCTGTGGQSGIGTMATTAAATTGITGTAATGGGQPFDNRQASVAFLYCQKN